GNLEHRGDEPVVERALLYDHSTLTSHPTMLHRDDQVLVREHAVAHDAAALQCRERRAYGARARGNRLLLEHGARAANLVPEVRTLQRAVGDREIDCAVQRLHEIVARATGARELDVRAALAGDAIRLEQVLEQR